MELTGQCKKDFDNWLLKGLRVPFECFFNMSHPDHFYQLSQSMKYGVYVDFFDSKNLTIFIDFYHVTEFKYSIWNLYVKAGGFQGYLTRAEARTEAIKKANEIYNTKL